MNINPASQAVLSGIPLSTNVLATSSILVLINLNVSSSVDAEYAFKIS